VQTIHHTTERVRASPVVSAPVKVRSVAAIAQDGPNFQPPPGTPPREAAALSRALDNGVADGARFALLFAAALVTIGSFLSLLIPPVGPFAVSDVAAGALDTFEAFEPMDPDRAMLVDAESPAERRDRE
jgi:hypothetical protein